MRGPSHWGWVLLSLVTPAAHAIEPPKVGGLIQTWAIYDGLATAAKLNFRIRRADIKLSGKTSESVRYFIVVDPAKSLTNSAGNAPAPDSKILQDVGVGVSLGDRIELIAGQFKMTTTAEGLDSSSELWFPERSLHAKTYGDIRQPGIELRYKHEAIQVSAMGYNGAGGNQDDSSTAKDLAIRVDYQWTEQLRGGAFTRLSNFSLDPSAASGVNIRAKPIARLEIRGDVTKAHSYAIRALGYSIDLGYQWDEKCMPALRIDSLTPNRATGLTTRAYLLALNHQLGATGTKLQASYGILRNVAAPTAATGSYSSGTRDGTMLTFVLQAAF